MKNFEDYYKINEELSDDELSEILLNTIKYYLKNNKSSFFLSGGEVRKENCIRALGFMEGILVSIGELKPGEKLDYNEYTYKFLWIFPMKHTESYGGFIYRKSIEYLVNIHKITPQQASLMWGG